MQMWRYILAGLLLFSSPVFSSGDLTKWLESVDAIRSQDAQQFRQQLDELAQYQADMDREQLLYYEYLTGYSSSFQGDFIATIALYERIYAQSASVDLRLRAKISILNNYALARDFVAGYNQISQLLDLAPKAQEQYRLLALLSVSLFYNQAEDYSQGLHYAELVLAANPTGRNLCMAMSLQSEALYRQGQLLQPAALEPVIAECSAQGELIASTYTVMWQAALYQKQEQYDEAQRLLTSIQSTIEQTQYLRLSAEYYADVARLELAQQRYDAAQQAANKVVENADQMGNSLPLVSALKTLSLVAEAKGESTQALELHKRYAEVDKAHLDDVKVRQMAIQQAKTNALERANQIALLDKENALLDKENVLLRTQAALNREERHNHRLIIATMGLLVLLIVVWAYINRRMQQQLRKQAQRDGLTDIANRHYFTQRATSALNYANKHQQPVSFVIFDLDLFKQINDQFGHQTGDWALIAAVNAAKEVCRQQDILGRLGGEEFGLVLPGCDEYQAEKLANACRIAIALIDTTASGNNFSITASFGVSCSSQCAYDFDRLYACADEALYQSKHAGRNKVYRYSQHHKLDDCAGLEPA